MKKRLSIISAKEYPFGYYLHIAVSRSGHNFVLGNIKSWNDCNYKRKYVNFENFLPEHYDISIAESNLNRFPSSITVIQTRDLLNWFASMVCFGISVNVNRLNHYINVWVEINKEYFHETNYLPNNFIRISYDDFFKSETYRRSICEKIGGAKYNEKMLNHIPDNGEGSSFDKLKYQDMGQKMDVLIRYKQISDERQWVWKTLKDNPEAIELYLKHFDVSDEQKKFIDNI